MGSTTGVSSLDSSRPEGGFLFACCFYTGSTRWGQSYAQGQPTQERGPQQAPSPLDDCAHGGGRRAFGSQRPQRRPGQGSRTRCALGVHTEPIMMNQRRMLTRTRCGVDQARPSSDTAQSLQRRAQETASGLCRAMPHARENAARSSVRPTRCILNRVQFESCGL